MGGTIRFSIELSNTNPTKRITIRGIHSQSPFTSFIKSVFTTFGKRGFALAKADGLPYSLADMNLKQNCTSLAGFLLIFSLLTATGCSTALPYQESREGNYLYLNPLSHKPASSADHLAYADSLRKNGHLKSAREQYAILVKRWPDSKEASVAKQAVAELYAQQGKNKKSFTAYEELVKQYYTEIKDYDSILEKQYSVAVKEMNRKRMRWLFGGYRAPDRAVPLFESIIQNAPQWERAPEMQYMIGQAYQKNDDLELAIVAYAAVEYRYPDSPFAEKAALAKIDCYKKLVDNKPYSVDIREQAQLATAMFPEFYTNSQHQVEVAEFGKKLHEISAGYTYEIGEFYERVPRPPQNLSAAIYYNKVVRKYGDTEYAAKAAARLKVLFPSGMPADGSLPPIIAETGAADVGRTVSSDGGFSATEASGVGITVSGQGSLAGDGRATVGPLPERISQDPDAIEITADRMEYVGDLLVGEGNVALQQTGASLQADKVVVNYKTGEIKATGNVLMVREGNRWEGQELVYNYKTREGSFGKSFMYFEPAYITAEKTERLSTNEYRMTGVMMTTCAGDSPTVYARAKEVRVIDTKGPNGVVIKAKSVTFYVGPVPVFYMPYFERHLGAGLVNVVVGYGGDYGAFIKTRLTSHPTEWLTAESHFDVYSQRGLGLGQDFKWTTPSGGGKLETYYINDSDPQYDDDAPAFNRLIDSQRYRVKLTDREQINTNTYFATKLNWLSDPGVIKDFFNEEYRNEANPENYAVVQHSAENYAASLRADHRLNDFYTTVERIPEMSYDWYRSRVGDSPFHFQSENNAAFLEHLNGETNIPPVILGDNYRSARMDTYNQLYLPLRFKEFFNVIPRAGYRGTWYSDTVSGGGNLRNIFELGTLTSFKAYKTLTDKSGFYGTGLRHIVEPYADYSWRPEPNLRPDDLYQFDSVDALDKQNEVRLGLRNLLQTKRGDKRIANFLDADVYTVYRFDHPPSERAFSNLVTDVEMSLTDNFFVQSDLEYNWYTHTLSPANMRFKYVTDDQSEYRFEYRYLDGVRSLFTPSVVLFPNDKWSYEFSASYDGTYDEWYERKILINHKFDCVGMGVGLKVDEDNQPTFWVQFWLTAFPRASFGM